jgi:hypothetical protein
MPDECVLPSAHEEDPEALRVTRLIRLISELQQVRADAALLMAAADSEIAAKRGELATIQPTRAVRAAGLAPTDNASFTPGERMNSQP